MRRPRILPEMKFFTESETNSIKSDFEVGSNNFPDIKQLILRQNPTETEILEHIADGQMAPLDQATSHESVSQQLK